MSATRGWCLRLKAQPDFRVDFGGVLPVRLAAMTADEVVRVEVRHGNQMLALGELFDVAALQGLQVIDKTLVVEDQVGLQELRAGVDLLLLADRLDERGG